MREQKIFDKFEHIGVYVVDKETMEVYYENSLAEKFSGRNRIGEPCYKVHGYDIMCSACPLRNRNHMNLVNRSDLNMVFAVRAEEVMWDNHASYVIIVVKQGDSSSLTEDEKSMSRMGRALQKQVNVYTEINMENMKYRQITLRNAEGYNIDSEGDYSPAYEFMCENEIHPDDVAEVRRTMAPEVLKRISDDNEGISNVSVIYRLKNVVPERIMESTAIFIRDEIPHYVVSIAKDVTKEENIKKQANTLEDILSNVNCGVVIYLVDESRNIIVDYVNEGLSELVECSKEVLLEEAKKDVMHIITPEYHDTFRKSFQKIIDGEKKVNSTVYVKTHKGNYKWVTVYLSSLRKENGVLQIYGTFTDVTAEMAVQREFQEKYEVEKRRSLDDTSLLVYGVFDLLNGSSIEFERREPLEPFGKIYSMNELRANVIQDIVSQENRDEFQELFHAKKLLAMSEQGIDEQSIEYQRKLPDGKVVWVRSTFRVITDAVKNTKLLFYRCNNINVTKSLELMTSYMVDEDYDMLGCINLMSDSAIMLYGHNSVRRQYAPIEIQQQERYSESLEWFVNHAVVKEEQKYYQSHAFIDKIKENLTKNENYEFVLHVYNQNQEIRAKKIRYTRYDTKSNICFFSQTDITETIAEEERKQQKLQDALKAAEQANEAKTSFLSRMSHDMRTPMNGVLGLATLMRDETSLEEIAKDIDQLELSGKYLLQLINDTLDVSKIESGKMELRLKPTNSELLLGNILTNANMLAKEKEVKLKINLPKIEHESWKEVMADSARLEQVIMNIVSNAIKFTPKDGMVTLTMETVSITETEVIDCYIIEDTGIGMSEDFLSHIYEPFAQEGRMNTSRESGTGLGMSIVKQLVELMGGTISIQSEKDKGTKVTLIMKYEISREVDKKEEKKKTDLSILINKRVLLCEDHPLNAQIATRLLEKKEIKVHHASNGKLGMAEFEKSAIGYFDVILMDIRMPEMNGIDATKEIRKIERADAKTVPILAMTANAFEDDIKECLEAGMNGHIAKPIDAATMFETIAENIKG